MDPWAYGGAFIVVVLAVWLILGLRHDRRRDRERLTRKDLQKYDGEDTRL